MRSTRRKGPPGLPRLGAGGQTLLLTTGIAVAGAAAATALPAEPLLPVAPVAAAPGLVLLVAALFVAELWQVHVEVRRQAYSFSLTGVPLVLGLLFCPPAALVTARVAAALLAFAVQRVRPDKAAFNLAGYLLDACLLAHLANLLTTAPRQLDLSLAGAVYVALTACEVVATCLVLLVIRINTGPLAARDVGESVLTAVVFVVIATACGAAAALLLQQGWLGWLLLALLTALASAAYRAQVTMRRRQASLEVVKGFVELGAQTAADSGDLGTVLLGRLREVVRAERAKILVPADDGGGGWAVQRAAHEDGAPARPLRTGRRGQDSVLGEVADAGAPRLLRRDTADRYEAAFLSNHDLREAMLCPVDLGDRRGLVLVADRLGETATFGRHDLALLQTLAGHLAVALRSAWLLEKQRHDARHDALTGLPNMLGLSELAAPLLAASSPPAVLVLTLDRAAEVNAVLGHSSGDELLELVARRLELALPGALVGRLGGDQFAAVLAPRDGAPALDEGLAAAERVEQVLDAPVQLTSASVSTTASLGLAVAAADDDLEAVVRRADTARTSGAVDDRATGPVVYTASMDEGRAERVELLSDLRRALDTDELMLHYQPKLDLAFGLVTGVEALVRWDHPRLGRLSPDRFVPLAESTGLVEPFTHHLLGVALRQLRTWQDGGVDVSVAVNLSARNVANPALPDLVAAALARAGVPATRLTLELTESTVMGDPARTVPVLERLAAIGVTLSLDDFGTGYSSLSYLQRLPVRELKIDRSFVRGLESSASPQDTAVAAALIRSITALKDALGLRIVAEGVEDAEVLERVRELGCDIVQGYHVARPAAADQLDTSTTRLLTTGEAVGG